ncbi:DUF5333 domain-containing protein [Ostreiculturibacter nitratireducens]|uniref:DUF5333 domain-containing protein n=1 Tax=Ostreiculturibacter nitratireducens TaxID=3075226 RepID=UPI0031B5C484
MFEQLKHAAIAAALVVSAIGGASRAEALPPLSQNSYINERLIAGRVGDLIQRNCPNVSGRLIYAYTQAKALQRYALDLGYSEDEVETFLKDKVEKRRVYAAADAYLAEHGVVEGNEESYCRVGLEEIEKGSIIGSLLRAN